MRKSEVLFEYGDWILAFVCFCLAFSGIFAKSIPWIPYRPFTISCPEEYLLGRSALLVGVLYLIAGIGTLLSTKVGIVVAACAFLLTWILGNFVQQRPSE